MPCSATPGVEFFARFGDEGTFAVEGVETSSVTLTMGLDGLPLTFGRQYFGDFARALFTMLQALFTRTTARGRCVAHARGSPRACTRRAHAPPRRAAPRRTLPPRR
jgi:hypothetical protein